MSTPSESNEDEREESEDFVETEPVPTSTDDIGGPISSKDTEASESSRDDPEHIHNARETLRNLRDRLENERFFSQHRDQLTESLRGVLTPIDKLTGPDVEITWYEPYRKVTADQLAEIVDEQVDFLSPDYISDWPPEPAQVAPIVEGVKGVHDQIGELPEFPYAYTELEIKERYGKEQLISVGIPDNIDEDAVDNPEEWYAGPRGVTAMQRVPQNNPSAPLHVGTDTRTGYDVSIDKSNLFVHRAIFGQTGKGKSTLLTNNFRTLMETDAGGCFIDPKGDDSLRLLQILPKDRIDDVIWIEPGATGDYISGFNFISTNVSPDSPHYDTIVSNLVEDMVKVLSAEDTWHTRMDRVARTLITVMNEYNRKTPDDILDLNFVDMYYILKDEGSRQEFRALIEQTDIEFKAEYLDEIAEMEDDMLEPLLGRFLKWIQENTARRMIGFREESVNISEAVENDKIIIVRMGMENKRLKKMVGTAIIRRIWSHIRSRANQERHEREPFYLYCDEFDNLVLQDDTIETMFSESRSYKLSLNAAMQYPGQVRSDVMDGVLNNAKTVHGYNPGRAKSAKAYNTELGIDVDTLTDEADFHQWMRVDTNDGLERSDAFRVYTHPPFPPLRSREEAQEIRDKALEEHGREIPTTQREKARLLFNEGKGRWEHGEGQRLKMTDDPEEKLAMMQQLLTKAPDPEGLPIRDTAGGGLMNSSTSGATMSDAAEEFDVDGNEDDGISYTEETLDSILEATFSVRVQNGYNPSEMIPLEEVEAELENRHGDLGYVNKLGNVLERFPDELLKQGTKEDGMALRLTASGRQRVISHDSGADASAGGVKHRHLCGEAFIMASVLGYQASIPSQEEAGELPDAVGEPPIDLERADTLNEARELIETVEKEYPTVANLTDGKPLTMEIETSTFEKPIRTITNLRKAVNAGRYCLFVVPDGTHAEDAPDTYKDDSFDYYAKCIERLLYDATYRRNDGVYEVDRSELILAKSADDYGNRKFYAHSSQYKTANHHEVLRPEPDGRGDITWKEDGNQVVVSDNTTDEIARFDSISQALEAPESKVTYLKQRKLENDWAVIDGDGTDTYESKDEAVEGQATLKAPYIPDTELNEWPTADDFGIVIMPGDDNDQYDQPQLYIEGDLYPLYEYLGEGLEPPAVTLGDVDGTSTEDSESSEATDPTEAADAEDSDLPFCPGCGSQDWSKNDDEKMACGVCGYQPPKALREEIESVRAAESDQDDSENPSANTLPDEGPPKTEREAHEQGASAVMETQEAADPVNKPDNPDELDTDHRDSGSEVTEADSEPTSESPEARDDSDLVGGDDEAFEQEDDSAERPHTVTPEDLSGEELSQQMWPHLTDAEIEQTRAAANELYESDGPPNEDDAVKHEVLSNHYDPEKHNPLVNPDVVIEQAHPSERPETAILTTSELRERLPLTEVEEEQLGPKSEELASGSDVFTVDEAERYLLLEYYDPETHQITDADHSPAEPEPSPTPADETTDATGDVGDRTSTDAAATDSSDVQPTGQTPGEDADDTTDSATAEAEQVPYAFPDESPTTVALSNKELREQLPLTESQKEKIGHKVKEHTVYKHSELSADEIERRELLQYYDPDEHDLNVKPRDSTDSRDDTPIGTDDQSDSPTDTDMSGDADSNTDTERNSDPSATERGDEGDPLASYAKRLDE